MRRIFFIVFCLVIFTFVVLPPAFAKPKNPAKITTKSVELKLNLRDQWTGQIFWIRNFVMMTKFGDREGAKVADAMAIKHDRAIADSLVSVYGKGPSGQFFDLLGDHYEAIKEYMSSTYRGDPAAQRTAIERIKKNAENITFFLTSENPGLSKQTVLGLMIAQSGHHISEIDEIQNDDFASESKTWDTMKTNAFLIADALAEGIVKQFPKKF